MIQDGMIEQTDLTAELKFETRDQANAFARAWTFKSLMGHTITGTTVKVYNVTPALKAWIDNYVKEINTQPKGIKQ